MNQHTLNNLDGNLLLLTDSYKLTHWRQYPADTEYLFSYFCCRTGGRFRETVFYGLHQLMMKYLEGVRVTPDLIRQAESVTDYHFYDRTLFNRKDWDYIASQHDGRLPVKIFAPPEGMVIPEGNALIGVVNTDPRCAWLVNYLETLLVQVWYPITVATLSREFKRNIATMMDQTAGHRDGLEFKLHDFGFRGASSVETAAIGGSAHLVNFSGTDTLAALSIIDSYYGGLHGVVAASIPASEHSTITAWGRDHELEACRNMLDSYPDGLVACVSDSYDLMGCIESIWGDRLKEQILNRNGTLVIRPDSGDPVEVLPDCLAALWERFGGRTNLKGYRVLDSHVRLIWGDGIDIDQGLRVMRACAEAGYSIENLAFGMGGGLLQKVDRDTQRCVFKASAIRRNGVWQGVRKEPKTDASKASLAGVHRLVQGPYREDLRTESYLPNDRNPCSLPEPQSPACQQLGLLQKVFENGHVFGDENNFKHIRERARLENSK